MPTLAEKIHQAVTRVKSEAGLLDLLRDVLEWGVPDSVESFEDLGYDWTEPESKAKVWQLLPGQPWGIFLVLFPHKPAFRTELRRTLRRLVSNRRDPSRPAWQHENLLFLCITGDYKSIAFAHFRGEVAATARLASFGWSAGDSHVRTLCEHNLPKLLWPADPADADGWLKQWAAAFDVEAVTKSFFKEYKDVFEHVESKATAVPKGEARRLYTQRLFNRLLFLYFIQKKGWLDFNGDKNYLRALFKAAEAAGENFLNDRLFFTFFNGLNTFHEGKVADKKLETLIGNVPFLNGGLFDQLEDEYDVRDAVKIPNAAFGKVLDLFERYNFTVAESTPLDVEVAVDPEMLGKVFEELVTGRHESGSYYTPRPIVSFMCREALKYYLQGALTGSADKLDAAKREGSGTPPMSTNRTAALRAHVVDAQTKALESAVAKFVDDGDPSGLTGPEAVLAALKRVKVCDPACGSGAYLLGMMQELLRLREALFAAHAKDHTSIYDRKLEIIQNNLYGVDLDEFAVNIAKLRLWLSLAVDYTGAKPEPLPNLDFKIERGDSLTAPDPQKLDDLIRFSFVSQVDELAELKAKFITAHGDEKRKLKAKIGKLQEKLESQMPDQSPTGAVDWRVAFAEVFKEGGFDIVMANPPYLRIQVLKKEAPELAEWLKRAFKSASKGNYDIYVVFVERSLQLMQTNGQLAFIMPHKFFNAQYGEPLRKVLADGRHLRHVVHFGDQQVFPGATNYVCIMFATREGSPACRWERVDDAATWMHTLTGQAAVIPADRITAAEWNYSVGEDGALFERLGAMPVKLENVADRIFQGLKTSSDKIYIVDEVARTRSTVRIFSRQQEKEFELEPDLLHPLIKGGDSRRYSLTKTKRLILFPYERGRLMSEKEIRKRCPQTWKYLIANKEILEAREDGILQGPNWYAFGRTQALDVVALPKLFTPDIAVSASFSYDMSGELFFTGGAAGGYGILVKKPYRPEYVLGLLNSRLVDFYHHRIATQMRGGWFSYESRFIRSLPIRPIDFNSRSECIEHDAIVGLVEKILIAKRNEGDPDTTSLEREIDERVIRLYELTSEEVSILNASSK